MDLKLAVTMEVVKGERNYVFILPHGAPYGEAYDAAYEILNKVMEMAKDAADKAKPASAELEPEVVAEQD